METKEHVHIATVRLAVAVPDDILIPEGYTAHSLRTEITKQLLRGNNPDSTVLDYSIVGVENLGDSLPVDGYVEGQAFAENIGDDAMSTARHLKSINRLNELLQKADPERVRLGFALAAEVSAVALRTVFEAVVSGSDSWRNARWLFCLKDDSKQQTTAHAEPIGRDDVVMSLGNLTRLLLDPENSLSPSNKELADIASACNQKLAQRMGRKDEGKAG